MLSTLTKALSTWFKKPSDLDKGLRRYNKHFASKVYMSVFHINIVDYIETIDEVITVCKEKGYLSNDIKTKLSTVQEVATDSYLLGLSDKSQLSKHLTLLESKVIELKTVSGLDKVSADYYSRHAKTCMVEYEALIVALKLTGDLYEEHKKNVEKARYNER